MIISNLLKWNLSHSHLHYTQYLVYNGDAVVELSNYIVTFRGMNR